MIDTTLENDIEWLRQRIDQLEKDLYQEEYFSTYLKNQDESINNMR